MPSLSTVNCQLFNLDWHQYVIGINQMYITDPVHGKQPGLFAGQTQGQQLCFPHDPNRRNHPPSPRPIRSGTVINPNHPPIRITFGPPNQFEFRIGHPVPLLILIVALSCDSFEAFSRISITRFGLDSNCESFWTNSLTA